MGTGTGITSVWGGPGSELGKAASQKRWRLIRKHSLQWSSHWTVRWEKFICTFLCVNDGVLCVCVGGVEQASTEHMCPVSCSIIPHFIPMTETLVNPGIELMGRDLRNPPASASHSAEVTDTHTAMLSFLCGEKA